MVAEGKCISFACSALAAAANVVCTVFSIIITATTTINNMAGPLLSQMDAVVADGDMGDTVPTPPPDSLPFSPNHSTRIFPRCVPPIPTPHSTLPATHRLLALAKL
jgi:hypothetical protein